MIRKTPTEKDISKLVLHPCDFVGQRGRTSDLETTTLRKSSWRNMTRGIKSEEVGKLDTVGRVRALLGSARIFAFEYHRPHFLHQSFFTFRGSQLYSNSHRQLVPRTSNKPWWLLIEHAHAQRVWSSRSYQRRRAARSQTLLARAAFVSLHR